MNNLQIFQNSEFGEIRAVEIDGEPWLVGKDVARALGYKDTVNALKLHVDAEDKKGGWQITTPSGTQEMTIINESGLYCLIFSSRLPSAKAFKRWVTSEVLPAIRKTGMYAAPGAVQLAPTPQPNVSLVGLAKVANVARRAVLDMGGTGWEAGAEVLQILDHCGFPIPEFAKRARADQPLRLEDFWK